MVVVADPKSKADALVDMVVGRFPAGMLDGSQVDAFRLTARHVAVEEHAAGRLGTGSNLDRSVRGFNPNLAVQDLSANWFRRNERSVFERMVTLFRDQHIRQHGAGWLSEEKVHQIQPLPASSLKNQGGGGVYSPRGQVLVRHRVVDESDGIDLSLRASGGDFDAVRRSFDLDAPADSQLTLSPDGTLLAVTVPHESTTEVRMYSLKHHEGGRYHRFCNLSFPGQVQRVDMAVDATKFAVTYDSINLLGGVRKDLSVYRIDRLLGNVPRGIFEYNQTFRKGQSVAAVGLDEFSARVITSDSSGTRTIHKQNAHGRLKPTDSYQVDTLNPTAEDEVHVIHTSGYVRAADGYLRNTVGGIARAHDPSTIFRLAGTEDGHPVWVRHFAACPRGTMMAYSQDGHLLELSTGDHRPGDSIGSSLGRHYFESPIQQIGIIGRGDGLVVRTEEAVHTFKFAG